MEPITMASTVAAILAAYVAKGAEEFIKAAGKDAYEKTRNLFTKLKAKLAGNEEASSTLHDFENEPERYKPALKKILEDELMKDEDFRVDLDQKLHEIGPHIEVIQKISKGGNIIALEAEEIRKGTVRIEQEIGEADSVTGPKFGRIG